MNANKLLLIEGIQDLIKEYKETTNNLVAMDVKAMRQQQSSPTWRTMVFKVKGKKCAVCGSKQDLQIHHVQAIANGGSNRLDNLLVVCQKHHMHLHDKIFISNFNSGRKANITFEDALPVLHRYFNSEIGRAECLTLLGYSPTNHTTMTYMMKEYKKQFKVRKDFRNTVDIVAAQPQRRETYQLNRQAKILDKVY